METLDPCFNGEVTVLDDAWRATTTYGTDYECDTQLNGWFRFTLDAKNAPIPTACVLVSTFFYLSFSGEQIFADDQGTKQISVVFYGPSLQTPPSERQMREIPLRTDVIEGQGGSTNLN